MKKLLSLLLALSMGASLSLEAQSNEFRYYDAQGEVQLYNTQGSTMMSMITGIKLDGAKLAGAKVLGLKVSDWPFQLGMSNYYIWATPKTPGWDDNAYAFKYLENKVQLNYVDEYTAGTLEGTFEAPITVTDEGLNIGIGFKLAQFPNAQQKQCIPYVKGAEAIPNSFYLGKAGGYWGNYAHIGAITMTVLLDGVNGIEEVDVQAEKVQYFNLLGQPVSNPQKGVYLKKTGTKCTKVRL